MIFRRISYILALQFTGFVFGLLLLTGMIFLGADLAQRRHETQVRLERQLKQILANPARLRTASSLPQFQRERIRITDLLGRTLYAGTLYDTIPFASKRGIVTIERGRESYDILTAPFIEGDDMVGYIQVADRTPPDDLSARVFLFLVVSSAISGLTFGVGLLVARRNLRPAEQMMHRLEQFTQDASHELRTPLTAVSTSLDLALTTQDNHALVAAAKNDLKDITTLIERLLELAQLDAFALHTEHVDLSALVADHIARQEQAAAAKKITLTSRVEPRVRKRADPALIRQVVANLLGNAIKFTPPGGTVTVTLTSHALTVADTGKGIAPTALGRIFDRFFQEDRARSGRHTGLGLGLALTKRIIDLHHWKISVESMEGKGSTFTVRF